MAGDSKPRVKVFDCTNCGAPVTLRNLNSLSAACPQCHATLDVTSEAYKILSVYKGRTGVWEKHLEFGTRGKLQNRTWEVIGFLARRDVASGYPWQEYLLFNPYYGYRWLTEDKGQWNLVTPIKEKPIISVDASKFVTRAEFGDHNYKLYNRGDAVVTYVEGEFYWKIKVGDKVNTEDYISPPFMLSSETDGAETSWSHSEYIAPEDVAAAFKIERKALPSSYGYVSATMPSPVEAKWRTVWPFWLLFLVICTAFEFMQVSQATSTVEFDFQLPFTTNAKVQDFTTPTFVVTKDKGNLELGFSCPSLDNSWFWCAGELVNDTTGDTYTFERSLEYYHGYSDGESWSEGSSNQKLLFSNVPGGTYYINMDYESGAYPSISLQNMNIKAVRDVPMFANYFWAIFLLSIYPILLWGKRQAFEVARWANSDYSPFNTSSEE